MRYSAKIASNTSILAEYRPIKNTACSQLNILCHCNQDLQLLRGQTFEFFQNVCIIIQLQEPRIELHLLGKREGIDIAVGDISVYRVTHTLGYVVMRNSGVSKVCRKGVSAPGAAI